MKKIRLLFITQDLAIGGGTSSLSSLYDGIKDKYDVSVLLLTKVGNANVSYADKIIFPNYLIDCYYSDYSLSKGFRKISVGMVKALARFLGCVGLNLEKQLANYSEKHIPEANYYISFGEGPATSFTSYFKSSNKITWIHYDITYYPKRHTLSCLLNHFKSIVCVADNIAKGMKSMYPELSDKIYSIHNLVDDSRIIHLAHDKIEECFSRTFNIVSIGRISTIKGFINIPLIARQLADMGLDFHWRVIGPNVNDNEYMSIQSDILKYNVNDFVELIGNRQNPYPYLQKSNLLVSTSYSEACPMVLLEARILGVPIIANNFTTASEFIENDKDGIICSIPEMAISICKILCDEKFRDILILNSSRKDLGKTKALNEFDNLVKL